MEMTKEELAEIVRLHGLWLIGHPDGKRANLCGRDLSGDDLCHASLADLYHTDLSGADLSGANLSKSYLDGANLSGADLTDARFAFSKMSEVNLVGAKGICAPVIPHIDAAILNAIRSGTGALNMLNWHTCDTVHCRAGRAIHLAGEQGYALEKEVGPNAAGALIYAVSRPGKPVPNWYARNYDAMADLEKCAAEDPLPV